MNIQNHSTFFKILITIFIIIILIFMYARFYETKHIKVVEKNIIDENVPDIFYGYKIVQLSDIHYKTTINNDELNNIVKKVNKIKPDIVALTGDLLDKEINYNDNDIKYLAETLNKIDCKYKYIVLGDQDDIDIMNIIIKKINYKLLNNDYDIIYNNNINSILIGGITSKSDESDNKTSKIEDAIKKNNTKYNILLTHEPSNIDSINFDNYNLVLAGHTLNGQINIPLIKNLIIPKDSKKYTKNYYKYNNTKLYISNGLGTTGFKARLFNKPTINLYRLMNK